MLVFKIDKNERNVAEIQGSKRDPDPIPMQDMLLFSWNTTLLSNLCSYLYIPYKTYSITPYSKLLNLREMGNPKQVNPVIIGARWDDWWYDTWNLMSLIGFF